MSNQESNPEPEDGEQPSGKGLSSSVLFAVCPTCNGNGSVMGRDRSGYFPGSYFEADLSYNCEECNGEGRIPISSTNSTIQDMENDEAHLTLKIDISYDLGRTEIRELERILISAADYLAGNGMLSGETEASVLRWSSGVLQSKAETNKALPKLNIRCECSDGTVHGSTYLNVIRVDEEDDGSFTAVTDHWPSDTARLQKS